MAYVGDYGERVCGDDAAKRREFPGRVDTTAGPDETCGSAFVVHRATPFRRVYLLVTMVLVAGAEVVPARRTSAARERHRTVLPVPLQGQTVSGLLRVREPGTGDCPS
jgi:hypothetical protein